MTALRRPTPAEPWPDTRAGPDVPSGASRDLPPELGPDAIGVLEGRTFMFSDARGDVPRGSIGGLVHDDTRFLSQWELTIDDQALSVLSSGTVDAYSAAFFLANADLPLLPANRVGLRRQRVVGDGLYERIELRYFGIEPVTIRVRLAVGADFADLFEIKESGRDRAPDIERQHERDGSALRFGYRNGSFTASVRVEADPPADLVDGDALVWDVRLERGHQWSCDLKVPLRSGEEDYRPVLRGLGETFDHGPEDPSTRWAAAKPRLHSDSDLLGDVYHQSAVDLVSMRIEKTIAGEPVVLFAAGLPWFLTVFGRDTLITAYQSMICGPDVARGALIVLASHQAKKFDDFTDQEPGKIFHEYRSGELTQLGLKPFHPYYGGADTTALWLILLSEYWRWTGDDHLVRSLRDNAEAALRWIDHFGDRDGDGYVEYATRSTQGLGNQCWRDSPDGIQYADGGIPVLPIATCETQGYTYDAKRRMAELAAGPWHDPDLAQRLHREADRLREQFNRDYWIPERGGYYAVGLDGDKRPIDSMTSNMGHLLWSGIVPDDRAAQVARHLMSPELFSGWGVRTLSTADVGYNPIGYHVGTVWPHDNSIIAAGLARYGHRDEANRIAMAMLEASRHSQHRLPEAFSGYDRSFGHEPVAYPTACNPQAWASGAPLLFLRTMLGLEPGEGRLVADAHVPDELGRIRLHHTAALGRRWNIDAAGSECTVLPAD
ncbi:amylo-alpha-1,6-glucosidase [Micromonospora parathelypteridis]|uniref:Glycogen debranching enzyme n=1 Tax=Micromonospora parathelypteridis TaxID=1839617 RepID=A0A840VY61_9ACTN|nr:glycogen debranching N-terminal domain-containing protein [Micromonospora parathelypteridis]MBB5480926.1 glycogen debranching enzyme [Micromonospora parathelypteridis]GGO20942.1 amylo-alpha-1,6-glucosidase [Micromonospora parathelypteridis]